MPEIDIPASGWMPRAYQRKAWGAAERGVLRHALAWHRRAGKDDFALHRAACGVMERIGTYWHMLPEASQARKAIWEAVDPHLGRRRIDIAFPQEIRETTREQEMLIRFKNGSTWQVVGSDNYNSLVGSPPVGVVFSEYALADPNAWAYLRPILAENGGWAMFISTPRGRNHFAKMIEFAKQDPAWFAEVLTVEDTGAISQEAINQERRELYAERGETEAEAVIAQEYYCSFDAALPGAYYGDQMGRAERQGRIGPEFRYVPGLPVGTAWDIGKGKSDSMTIWFWQDIQGRPRVINYLEGSNVGLEWYAKRLLGMPYVYADHILPHDASHPQHTATVNVSTVSEMLGTLGIKNRVIPRDDSLASAINAVRAFIDTCEFTTDPMPFLDETRDQAVTRMARGLDTLRMYHREWSSDLKKFHDHPKHDWASHGADGYRTLARGHRPLRDQDKARAIRSAYATT
jgi:phage terminase large subunit